MEFKQIHQKFSFDKVNFALRIADYFFTAISKSYTQKNNNQWDFNLETVIVQENTPIHDLYKGQKKESKQKVVNVSKNDKHGYGKRDLSEEEIKLKKTIDNIFFNKLFVNQHLDELENELNKLEKNDSTNPLLIQGNWISWSWWKNLFYQIKWYLINFHKLNHFKV